MVPLLRHAAFIDRDGVINEERNYVCRADDFVLLPGATEGLQKLQSLGFQLIVVTNQSGIARGLYSDDDYQRLTRHMREQLLRHGITLTAVYHCPHHPEHGTGQYKVHCACRKPGAGMLFRARDEFGVDLSQSVMVGDKSSDIEAGKAAGLKFRVLVRSGHPVSDAVINNADACCSDLLKAAFWIASQLEPPSLDENNQPAR